MSAYLATFLIVGYAAMAIRLPFHQCVALVSVSIATAVTVWVLEHGRWKLGFFVPPRLALLDFVRGALLAILLVTLGDALVMISSNLRHARGDGFPLFELFTVFLPAALHEELVFRGYLFQKMLRWRRGGAIAVTSLVFAALHGGNRGISALAVLNLILAGVLLALAYERYQRLWFPIGIHMLWNVLSGPVLGYDVSGYSAGATVLRTLGSGPAWITGGNFGIEGSCWMGVAELGGILWMNAERRMQNAEFRKGR